MSVAPTIYFGSAYRVPKDIRLSSLVSKLFENSNIGFESVVNRTDGTLAVQSAIDLAASKRNRLIWDISPTISAALRFGSNVNILVDGDHGAVMARGVNVPMFLNRNIRFRDNARIVDHDIKIDGGQWNGNAEHQTTKGGNVFGLTNVFSFFGVAGLTVKNHKIWTPRVYCQQAINVTDGVVEDFEVNVGSDAVVSTNRDGVHFDGWCKGCRISRGRIHTWDDGIGVNADDLYYSGLYGDGVTAGFWFENPCGAASDILIEDIEFFNNSFYGVRLLSSFSRVTDITVKNLSGNCTDYSLLIDNYLRDPHAIIGASTGNFGKVIADGNTVTVNNGTFNDSQNAKISVSASIDELIMTNIAPNPGNVPDLAIYRNGTGLNDYKYGRIMFNGADVTNG